MNPREAVLLSPYRPPTSYPVSLNPDEAEAWLHGYFALWHPAVLGAIGRPPMPASTHDHDVPRDSFLYVVPTGPALYQAENWNELLLAKSSTAFVATPSREETQANLHVALAEFNVRNPESQIAPELLIAPAELVKLFEAVGFGFLLLETLFDAASHDRMLDDAGFWIDVSTAVVAAKHAGQSAVREALQAATAKLGHARQVLNSSGIKFMDLAIRTSTVHHTAWPLTLHADLPMSVLCSAETLEQLATTVPARFAELRTKFEAGRPSRVDLCVGSYRERDDAYLPAESQWWNLRAARATVKSLFEIEPKVYARTRSAFHPHLPGWLLHAGYKNAVLIAFDGALVPGRNGVVVNWPAPDGQSMDAFARTPIDASDALTFFNLACTLHSAFSRDATPTVAFRHGEHPAAVGYEQLVLLGTLGDACGEWTNLSRFFGEQHYGDYLGQQTADDYFCDDLDDLVTNALSDKPVSQFAEHLRQRRHLDSALTLLALYRSLTPPTERDEQLLRTLEAEERSLELGELNTRFSPSLATSAQLLAERIQVRSEAGKPGVLVFNPCNFTRRVALELDDCGGPIPVFDPVKAAEFHGTSAKLVVEVPSLGFAWIPRGHSSAAAPKPRIKTAEGNGVRNEFLEAEFDPETGAIRSVRDLRSRVNRLGMQLVFNPGSVTKARSVTVTNSGTALGEVVCEGDILDEHNVLKCRFKQRLRAWVGRPVLELRIELDPVHQPSGYAWHAYYGARFAWRDPRAALFRGSQGSADRTTHSRPVSADYLEARLGAERTFVFTGGLPFLQKHDARMADVVLVPQGETGRVFDLLIAFDRDYPMQTAQGWVTPSPIIVTDIGPPHIGQSGWLAHIDLPSVLMTSLRPTAPSAGHTRAVAMRLMETAGFAGAAEVRFARDPNAAARIDNDGHELNTLGMTDGSAPVEFSATEAFRIRAEWV